MEDGNLWLVLSMILLIAFSAYFSASETAYSSLNKIRLRNYVENGNKKAKRALALAEDYDTVISTILVGNNLVNIASSSIGTVLFVNWFGGAGVAISTVVMTIVILIFGEVMPKSIAKDNAESVALFVASSLGFMTKVFMPLVYFFKVLKQWLAKVTKSDSGDTPSVTETELKYLIEDIEDQGVLEKEESELVQSALEFDEITVEEILTPRVDIVALDISDGIEKAKELFFESRYSRIPVYDDSIDTIVGILNQQQFFTQIIKGNTFTIADIMQPTLHVPPKKNIAALLLELQREKIHMAIVTDQYGGTLGLITLEDIIEELVGEIWDEHDEVVHLFNRIDNDTIEVKGDTNFYDLLETLDIDTRHFDSNINTVNGFAMEQLGKIVEVGDHFSYHTMDATVVSVDEKRIPTFHITFKKEPEETDL